MLLNNMLLLLFLDFSILSLIYSISNMEDFSCISSLIPTTKQNLPISLFIQQNCYRTQVHVLDAQWGQTNWNVRVWSRERFIAGPRKEKGQLVLKKLELSNDFQGELFIGKVWGEGCRVCNFLLIGWWGNRALFQESCAQPEIAILHLGGGLSSCRRTQRYCFVLFVFFLN